MLNHHHLAAGIIGVQAPPLSDLEAHKSRLRYRLLSGTREEQLRARLQTAFA
jgi:hypothetical protein